MRVWHWITDRDPTKWVLLGTRCDKCGKPGNETYVRRVEAHRNDACDKCGYPYDENGQRID
ncbi:MAG: hypothetical protein ACYS7Y_28690 [Planctomycetota bacterium]|jgi:hypothetical protein